MALITADRVKETSTTTSSTSYALAGAVSNFRAFSAVCADGDTTYYAAVDQAGSGWEVGLGTYASGGTLARTSILASSNSGNKVNWSAGTRDVFITHPARAVTVDVQEFTAAGTSTWTKPVGAKIVHIIMHGAGGGGGSGRRRGTGDSQNSQGAGGGVAGSRIELWVDAASLSSTETVVVGAGGTGGAARTTNGTNGVDGASGGNSAFKNWTAEGGYYGHGGAIGTGATTQSGVRSISVTAFGTTVFTNNNAGTNGSGNGGAGSRGGLAGGAGGSGGAILNATPTAGYSGGDGGRGGSIAVTDFGATGGGGAAGTASGGAGGAGAAADDEYLGGSGGGGGGNGTAQAAGAGGNGGYPGGGGGGGGASNAGFNSGAGGAGAGGYVRVTTYF